MQMRLSISLIAAALFTALAFGTTRADTFTYSLNAPTGYGGGTLTGTVAFVGNSGDPVPDLGASPNFSFNFTPSAGPSESWTQADPVGVSYIASLDFGGGLLGLASGVLVGTLMYRGLLKIPMRHFFTVTGWLVLLIAAGLASQAAGFLNQAGLLPALGSNLWDSSRLLDQSSIVGKMLHTLIGYTARPSGIQLLFYTVTLLTIFSLMHWVGRRHHPDGARAS